MKRKYKIGLFLLGLLVLIAAVSCKSAPPPAEEPPPIEERAAPPPSVTPPDVAGVNAASARAEAARKLVMDFDGPNFFPPEWKSADSLYTEAEQQKRTSTAAEARDSIDRYNKAADAMEALAGKTLLAAYEYAERELTAARQAAVNAGADVLIPDYLLDADNTVVKALDQYNAKDYYGAKDSAFNAYDMYTIYKIGLDAYKLRMEIVDNGLELYVASDIGLADDVAWSAIDDYEAGNYYDAVDKANEALLIYDAALKTAWESYASDKRVAASGERQKALDLKANVAVRDDFNSAENVYNRANAAFRGQRYSEAGPLYADCASMFEVVAWVALEKRQAAEAALTKANERVMESDETARNAERILEGGR